MNFLLALLTSLLLTLSLPRFDWVWLIPVTLTPLLLASARETRPLRRFLVGWLAGAGALFGALFLAYLGDFRRKGWFVLGGDVAFALCLIGFSLSTRFGLSLVFLFAMGFAIVCSVAVTNTLLQKLVTDEMRGRVMSMFMLSFIGAMPIGNLIAGAASHRFGVQRTLAAGGLIIAVFVVILTLRSPRLREL